MNLALIGPHIAELPYNYSNRQAHRASNLRLRPKYTNILRASQPNEALMLADELHQDTPQGKYLMRTHFGRLGVGDERTIKEYPRYDDYYREVVAPYAGKPWCIPVVGNEITMNIQDYVSVYLPWTRGVMRLASADGIGVAVGRWPAWHPDRPEFQYLQALGDYFVKYPGHVFSPNYYYTRSNKDALVKGIEFYMLIGQPETVVGEIGILKDPTDANAGFLSMGMSQEDAAKDLIDTYLQYLYPLQIAVLYYCKGIWWRSPYFRTDENFEKVLIDRRQEFIMIDVPNVPGYQVEVTADPSLRLREEPNTNSATILTIPKGNLITIKEEDSTKAQVGTQTWLRGQVAGHTGWVYAAYLKLPSIVPETVLLSDHLRIVSGYEERIRVIKGKANDILNI